MHGVFISRRFEVHKLFAAVIDILRSQIIIKLTLIRLLIQNDRVGKYIIKTYFLEILAARSRLQSLKISIAIDQAIHIDNRTVMDKVANVASAGQTDDTSGFGVCFEQRDNIHIRRISCPVVIRHGLSYRVPKRHPQADTNICCQSPGKDRSIWNSTNQCINQADDQAETQNNNDQLTDPVPLLMSGIFEGIVVKHLEPGAAQKGDQTHLRDSTFSLVSVHQQNEIEDNCKQRQQDQISPHIFDFQDSVHVFSPVTNKCRDWAPRIFFSNITQAEERQDTS